MGSLRQLEADLAAQAAAAATPVQQCQDGAAAATPSTVAVGQTAKDVSGPPLPPPVGLECQPASLQHHASCTHLAHPTPKPQLVASLELLLQQPAATPGRVALTALRRSHTTELPGGEGSAAATTPGFAALAKAGAATPAPTLLAAPTSSWRLAAERAASFKTPAASVPAPGAGLGSVGISATPSWRRQVSFAAPPKPASPTDDLLEEISRAVSPGKVPLALAPAAPPRASTPLFVSSAAPPAAAAPTCPLPLHAAALTPAWPPALQQLAASATCGSADEVSLPSFSMYPAASLSPSPAAAAAADPGDASRVAPPLPVHVDQRPPAGSSAFEADARQVLAELHRFGELEVRSAADFAAGLAATLGHLFAAPAPGCY